MGGRLRRFHAHWTFSPWAFSIMKNGLGWKWAEEGPPRLKTFLSGTNPDTRGFCERPSGEECNKEGKINKVSGETLYSTEERLHRKESNFRPVPPESLNTLPKIQNVDNFEDSHHPPSWHSHLHDRLKRCLLAYSYKQNFQSLPEFQARPQGLQFQSHALWAQYSTPDLHEGGRSSNKRTQGTGNCSGGLSGRLDYLGGNSRSVQGRYTESHILPSEDRLQNKRKEVPAHASSSIRMAGSSLGSREEIDVSSSVQIKTNGKGSQAIFEKENSIQEGFRKNSGLPTIRISYKRDAQGQIKRYKQSVAPQGYLQTQRSQSLDTQNFKDKIKALDISKKLKQKSSVDISSPLAGDSYRRILDWLGWSHLIPDSPGDVVTTVPAVPHQHLGGDGCTSILKKDQATQKYSHSPSIGQLSHSELCEQEGFQDSVYKSCNDSNLCSSQQKELAPVSLTPGRGTQCDSRLPIQTETSRVGMVSGREILSMDPLENSQSPGGSICDSPKSQTPLLCSPQPGPSGLCHGCDEHRLEPVGDNLSISTSQSSIESSPQTPVLQGDNRPCGASMAQEQLVPIDPGIETDTSPNTQPSPYSDDTNKECIRLLLGSQSLTIMDFLIFAGKMRRNLDAANVIFKESNKKEASIKQYNSYFKKLREFIKKEKPIMMTPNLTITFFRELFESGYAPGTITSLKSGLMNVFDLAFDIDLNDRMYASIPRACSNLRPSKRSTMLNWDLNKTLELASSISNSVASYKILLRKTLFLLALASGARLSELDALSREPGFVRTLPSGEMLLSPHPSFLAKNEDPQHRWQPWKITPLKQDPSLCPVKTLQDYLKLSEDFTSGPLFQREKGGTLTIKGIRYQIIEFIKLAEPTCIPKGHDIRKIAATLNFFKYMDFSALQNYTGWKSPNVFVKHYLVPIEALRYHTVAAGKVIHPEDHASD